MPVCSKVLKPLSFERELVGPDRQVGEDVLTLLAGDDEPGHPGVGLGDGDFHARQGAAGLVQDRARQLGDGHRLGESARPAPAGPPITNKSKLRRSIFSSRATCTGTRDYWWVTLGHNMS